jgi:hypothetical protein
MTFSVCYLIASVAHALLDLVTTLELTLALMWLVSRLGL